MIAVDYWEGCRTENGQASPSRQVLGVAEAQVDEKKDGRRECDQRGDDVEAAAGSIEWILWEEKSEVSSFEGQTGRSGRWRRI